MIGIVPHHLWAFWRWMPIVRAMVNMGKELEQVPDSGFLGYEVYVGLQPMIVQVPFGPTTISAHCVRLRQYWRSFDHMKKCPAPHWVALTQQNSGDPTLGVWHETFLVKSGGYEGVYTNMPPFGLGKVCNLLWCPIYIPRCLDHFRLHSSLKQLCLLQEFIETSI